MDVDKEFAQLQRRLDASLAIRVIQAEARLYGLTVKQYESRLIKAAIAQQMNGWAAVGRAYRQLHDQLVEAMQAFGRGWNNK